MARSRARPTARARARARVSHRPTRLRNMLTSRPA